MMVTPTDLQGEGTKSTLPAGAVDIRVVKCWFQSGVDLEETDKCVLTPELLLKDDKLVYVDLQEKQNYLRSQGPGREGYVLISGPDSHGLRDLQPKDSETLQPVDIEVASNKQFWVTVHVPEDAKPGDYTGEDLNLLLSTHLLPKSPCVSTSCHSYWKNLPCAIPSIIWAS